MAEMTVGSGLFAADTICTDLRATTKDVYNSFNKHFRRAIVAT